MERYRKLTKWLAVTALIVAFAGSLQASNDAGSPGAFMRFGSSARTLALGGAVSALGDGASSSYWNPGGLSQLRTTEITAMNASLFADTRYSFFSLGKPTDGKNVFSFSCTFVSSGEFEEADIYNDLGSTFTESEGVFTASYARGGSRFGYGITAKSVTQQINGISGSGFGADVGMYLRPDKRLSLGISLQNAIQPEITLDQYPEKLSRTLRSGFVIHLLSEKLLLLGDISKTEFSGSYFSSGIEVCPIRNLVLRAGYDSLHEQIGFGGGVRYKKWNVDFAQLSHELGATTVLSATMHFGIVDGVEIIADRSRFSPSGTDRSVDFHVATAIRGTVEDWEIVMTGHDGSLVKIINGQGHPPEIVNWIGDDNNGRLISDGTYKATVTITDDLGAEWNSSTDVAILGFKNRTKTPMRIDISGSDNRDKPEDK
jgi:hypothetical protein